LRTENQPPRTSMRSRLRYSTIQTRGIVQKVCSWKFGVLCLTALLDDIAFTSRGPRPGKLNLPPKHHRAIMAAWTAKPQDNRPANLSRGSTQLRLHGSFTWFCQFKSTKYLTADFPNPANQLFIKKTSPLFPMEACSNRTLTVPTGSPHLSREHLYKA
jgi:hypothetical protein